MFTGLVETQGSVVRAMVRGRSLVLVIRAPHIATRLTRGASVAVNGVCLSVTGRRGTQLTFDVIPETCRCTTLRALTAGDTVNIERALRASDRLDGHLVMGHVDATARVVGISHRARDAWVDVHVPRRLLPCIVAKGSIALDGVSLTVGRCHAQRVRVYLIPLTLRNTTLGQLHIGDAVNVEVDVLLKLARNRRTQRQAR
jgi:riboflavin synthase